MNTVLRAPNGVLYAGGEFKDAGGDAAADSIAQWRNGRWSHVATPPLGAAVNALAKEGI